MFKDVNNISRRNFLKGLVATTAVLALGGDGKKIDASTPKQENEVNNLRNEIEKRFNVKVRTTKEVYLEDGKNYDSSKFSPDLPEEWDVPRLQMVIKTLEILPKHFYQDPEKPPLIILLGNQNTPGRYSHIHEHKYSIEINANNYFTPDKPDYAPTVIAHELTHLIIPSKENVNGPDVSAWYNQVTEILGDYDSFAPAEFEKVETMLKDKFHPKYNSLYGWEPSESLNRTQEAEFDFLNSQLNWLYKKVTYDEYIAGMSQHYARGIVMDDPTFFVRMYTEVVGKEKAIKLHKFVEEVVYLKQS